MDDEIDRLYPWQEEKYFERYVKMMMKISVILIYINLLFLSTTFPKPSSKPFLGGKEAEESAEQVSWIVPFLIGKKSTWKTRC